MKRLVRDLMSRTVIALSPHDSLGTALDLFGARNIRHLPVVEDGALCGLLTERDLLRHTLAEASFEDQRGYLDAMKVDSVMAIRPRSVSPDMLLSDAARVMSMFKYGCVPVVESNRLVGILTEADFLKDYLDWGDHAHDARARGGTGDTARSGGG